MQGYERKLAPVKQELFQAVAVQCTALQRKVDVLEVGIGTGPNIRFYADQVRKRLQAPDAACMQWCNC